MGSSLLVVDDIDLIAEQAPGLLALLRAQLRLPLPPKKPANESAVEAGLLVLATTSTIPSPPLLAAFDDVIEVPLLRAEEEALDALRAASLLEGKGDERAAIGELKLKYPISAKRLMSQADFAWRFSYEE